ncbi:MAG: site-specific DNA-methyltransferase [Prevotella sp.]|nr:site-specific DNA-methyltransferase [Prevotella sp.]
MELDTLINELEGLTNDEKSELIKLLRSQKKYGLVWEDKPEDAEQRMVNEQPVLVEVPERAILSDDAEAPNHILIEGDNLETLTALSYTHAGKIDVIYIDPPYNTGNKDFIYNDSFVDKEDGYRHSKWLTFMDKRLKIAKNLLSDKGVIFISIDDNEQAPLKMLCDEVFGNINLCGQLIWRKKSGGGQTDIYFVTEHEYILVYQKSAAFKWIDPVEIQSLDEFKNEDERGKYNLVKLEKWGSSAHKEDRPSMYFPIKDEQGNDYFPIAPDGKPGRWRIGLQRMENVLNNNLIEWRKGKPYEKVYFDINAQKVKVKKSRSILYDVAENADGSYLLTSLFGKKDIFTNPKPVELITNVIRHHGNKSGIILDFFAGSGTTLHATMQLNAEDGGHRQCILVTNNENGICENVTYERNRKVIQGYTTPKGEEVPGLKANNLRYYKTHLLPREQTIRNKRALVAASTDLLCIKNDVYAEQERFAGKKLKPSCARYFDNGKTKMLVIYNELTVNAFAETIYHMEVDGKILIYVFSNTRYAYDDNFEDVLDKVELCALPAAIYDAYRNILPKQEMKFEDPMTESENDTDNEVTSDDSSNQMVSSEHDTQLSFDFK